MLSLRNTFLQQAVASASVKRNSVSVATVPRNITTCSANSKKSPSPSLGARFKKDMKRSVVTHSGYEDHQAVDDRRVGETEEQAAARRQQESIKVEEKMVPVYCLEDFQREIATAGDNLVVLEVESNEVCDSGIEEVPDQYWKEGKPEVDFNPCVSLKHTLQRCARDCPDVKFLNLLGDMDQDARDLCTELGVTTVPCIQFYKNGQMLWSIDGTQEAEQKVGEGVLYYGGYAAAGAEASKHIPDITTRAELQQFLQDAGDEIAVVDISTEMCEPCVQIFPAVLALSKNMKGYVRFARLVGDLNEETRAMCGEFKILEVPTFLFFKNSELKQRFVGSSRGDLIGQILTVQGALGDKPLPGRSPRRRIPNSQAPPRKRSGQAMW